jgi:hypothetical protein
MSKKLLVVFLSVFLVSCGELTGESTGANDISLSSLLGDLSFVRVGDNSVLLEGTADNGGDSGHNYNLSFDLPLNQSNEFIFFSDRSLNGGLVVTFNRIAIDKIQATFKLNTITDTVVFDSPLGNTEVSIDVHNDENDTHIIMWYQSGPFGTEECVDEETCIFNTDRFDTPWGSHGKGRGAFWGYRGSNSFIKKLEGPNETIFNH